MKTHENWWEWVTLKQKHVLTLKQRRSRMDFRVEVGNISNPRCLEHNIIVNCDKINNVNAKYNILFTKINIAIQKHLHM